MDRGRPSRAYPDSRRAAPKDDAGRSRVKTADRGGYDGRFGTSADAGRKRPTGSYRSQPSGSYRSRMGYAPAGAQRPSMRSGGDSYTRRPEPKQPQPKSQREKPRKKKVNVPILVLCILALAVLAALIVLVISSMGQTYHHLPTVERLSSAGVGA